MYKLPLHIIKKIYEFDPTFHHIFNNVMEELEYCTPFWRVITLEDLEDEDSLWRYQGHQYKYNLKFSDAKKIAYYWNYKFLYDPANGHLFLKWAKTYKPSKNYYKYIQTLLDSNIKQVFPKILSNIKQYRFLHSKNIKI
jgi:hypothetical protein